MMTKIFQTIPALFLVSLLFFSCKKNEISVDLEKGLVAYYPFDGDAKDHSKFENHGITHRALFESDRFGNSNSTMLFDGDTTYFWAEHGEHLNFDNEFSLTLWVKKNIYFRGSQSFLEKGASEIRSLNHSSYQMGYSGTGDFIFSITPNIDELPIQARLENTLRTTWTHMAGIFVNDSLKLYLNGELAAINVFKETLLKTGGPLHLGSFPNLTPSGDQEPKIFNTFSGNLDEVRIYNRALNEEEILKLLDL